MTKYTKQYPLPDDYKPVRVVTPENTPDFGGLETCSTFLEEGTTLTEEDLRAGIEALNEMKNVPTMWTVSHWAFQLSWKQAQENAKRALITTACS